MDTTVLVALSTAFLLGLEHSFEPDHIAAVSTIVTQHRSIVKSMLAGSFWGFGHTAVLLFAGFLVIILKVELHSQFFNFLVGTMLVVMGVWTIRNVKKNNIHIHAHEHGGKRHLHFHSHAHGVESHDHKHLPFMVGVVQGLAGSGVLVVLVMSTMGNIIQALLFVVIFGVGTILGMSVFSSALSLPLSLNAKWGSRIGPLASMVTGILSVLIGIAVVAGKL